ncbi:colicin-like pore-forming protein, partial [Escherichia coli]|nr:colicin-like pore-forming protein [Escherichia coli]
GAVATVTVPNGDVNKMNVHYNIGSGPSSGNKLTRDTIKSFLEFKAENEANAVNDAISKVNDFYKELASKYGDKLEKEAKALADEAKGKKIRNANEAIKAFDRYKDVLNKKFSVSDREAIA